LRVACRRLWLLACVMMALSLTGFIQAAPVRPDAAGRVVLNGRPYVAVSEWAAANRLAVQWNPRSGEMRLTSRWARLNFKADTQRVEHDGVMVWLSYPVLRAGDRLYVSQRDQESVLSPLMQPPRLPAGRKILTVAVNTGHGGKDPGNMAGERMEKQYTLLLAKEVERLLRRAGLKVVMVRERDVYLTREERPSIAKTRAADLYVSLHYNSTPGGDEAQGLETYCLTPAGSSSTNDRGGGGGGFLPGNRFDRENLRLAYEVHRAIASQIEFVDRGVRHARFKELTLAAMPAILVEGGFMNSREDGRKIYSEVGRQKYAAALVDGILAYKRLVERGQPE
jgi:N-acetylmuramoyl-L-alanine amidase